MKFNDPSLLDVLIEEVPRDFVLDLSRMIKWIYGEAHQRVFEDPAFRRSEALWLLPFARRALFESKVVELADRHNMQYQSVVTEHETHTYNIVRCGRFQFTGSAVRGVDQIPRQAMFREQHARINSFLRYPTLDFMGKSRLDEAEYIYGIILYGSEASGSAQPSFTSIAIPAENAPKWAANWSLQELATAYAKPPQAKKLIDDKAFPKKRRKRREDEGNT